MRNWKITFVKLSLTGHEVIPDDLQACHHLKKKEIVIINFKSRKQKRKILINRKNLYNKSENLSQLKFAGKMLHFREHVP